MVFRRWLGSQGASAETDAVGVTEEARESSESIAAVSLASASESVGAAPLPAIAEGTVVAETHASAEVADAADRHSKPPLNAIPDDIISDHPELKLKSYDMERSTYAQNVIAMPHNAVRLEIADMWGDILPSLQSRADAGFTREDSDDLAAWWAGFVRFALTTSLVDDYVIDKTYDDVYVGFDKETKQIERLYKKIKEKNNVYLEMAFRKMGKAVDKFSASMGTDGFESVVKSWHLLSSTLADIYSMVEELIDLIDRWCREPLEYKDLEKNVTKIYTNKKRWGENDSKRGEMIVVLTRWVNSEAIMREWMNRNLTKRELRGIDKWMDDYRANRLMLIDRFHQRKL